VNTEDFAPLTEAPSDAQNLSATEPTAMPPLSEDGQPPLLHNRKAPQYVRQQEQAWHRVALERAALGYTAKEIAEYLGCSAVTVQDILRQPHYQQEQVNIIRRNTSEDDKVYEAVKENVHEAVQTLASIMKDREVSPAYRIAACKELLDRRYGKPNQPVNRNTDVDLSKLSDAELVKLLQGN